MSNCTALAASERGMQILKQFPELIVGHLNDYQLNWIWNKLDISPLENCFNQWNDPCLKQIRERDKR